jgi:hypothetical protein
LLKRLNSPPGPDVLQEQGRAGGGGARLPILQEPLTCSPPASKRQTTCRSMASGR